MRIKKHIAVCLGISFLMACGSSRQDSNPADTLLADTARMDSTQSTRTDKTSTDSLTYNDLIGIEELATDWEMLTLKDGKYVIYQYCDANNSSIHIEQQDGQYIFTHNLGQMAEQYIITSYKRLDALTFRITCLDKYNNSVTKTATIAYQESPDSGLAEWTWYNSGDEVVNPATIYAEKKVIGKYPVVEEGNCEEM